MRDANPKTAYGATKPSLALIPPCALLHEALAFEQGAAKYGAYNWRENAVSSMTYLNAALRHIGDYLDGAQVAADSKVHNLAHARACLAILIDAEEGGHLVDDRPRPGQSEATSLRLQAWKKERT